jgi:hypothetical protein
MTKYIAFQVVNIYLRRHDTICIYKKHLMYLSGSQVRRENRPPCTINEGEAIDEQKEEKERGIDRRS